MKSSSRVLTALALSGALLLTGCSSAEQAGQADQAGQAGAEKSATQGYTTVVDQRGREVQVPGNVERIASAVIPAPTLIAALDGSWNRIVGINQSLLQSNKEGIISQIFPASVQTPVVSDRSFTPNMETLLGLDPDVFIQWGDRAEEIIKPAEDAGIASVGLRYGTQEDLEAWVKIFGDVIGKPERAQEFLAYMHEQQEAVSSQVKALGKPKVRGLQASFTKEKITVDSAKRYGQHVFDIAGIENMGAKSPTADGVVGIEQILKWDPEIIFLSSFDETTPQDLYDDPRLADVTAIKDKRVYRAPLGVFRWQVPCEEVPLYWNYVAALAYPGEFKVDLPALTKEKMKWMYNYEISDADYQKILRTDINNVSANYDLVAK